MLAASVRASIAHPKIVTALSLLIALLGGNALLNARLDVFPDFAPPHVLVQTEVPGLDAVQVEGLVTRPLEGLLAGAENVAAIRSTSSQGLSAIQVVFGSGGDPYRQRQVITEHLAQSAGLLPAGAGAPLLSPLSSSMEYLLHFGFTSDRLSPMELRDLVRWTVKPQILAVPGVAQAQIFGGDSRERQVLIDPLRLQAAGVTLEDVYEAVRRGTGLIGGGYLETATQRIVLQAQAPGDSPEALAKAKMLNQVTKDQVAVAQAYRAQAAGALSRAEAERDPAVAAVYYKDALAKVESARKLLAKAATTLSLPAQSAEAMARRLAREEGLFAGTSSGANVVTLFD